MEYPFLDPEVLGRLGAIPLESRQPMLGNVAGRHRSPNRGSSVEFAEYRKYVQGDDTRRLDWKAFARSDRYYIKEFEADTNLLAHMVIDTSGSMNFESKGEAKFDYAKKLAASIAYLAVDQGDAAGLSCIADKLNIEIPPRRRASHLQSIFKTLSETQPKGETGLIDGLHAIAEKVPRRGLIIIMSDLFCDSEAFSDVLQHLRYRKHDVVVFHLMDPQEIDFEFERPHRFVDLEDASTIVAEPTLIADEYRDIVQQFLVDIKRRCHDANADYHLVRTTENYESVLSTFLLDRLPKKGSR
ncbi:DUF58 domain-containing protein [Rubritalea spongiae]|uniref:DUF58 domain-containing protein n=1 Tax=Rubritalea spongiae TaxID=430797 RepID=A0ABW5E116_9BACT